MTGSVLGSGNDVGAILGAGTAVTLRNAYSLASVSGPATKAGQLAGALSGSFVDHVYAAGTLVGGDSIVGTRILTAITDVALECTTAPCASPWAQSPAEMAHPRVYDELHFDLAQVWGFKGASSRACLRFEPGCGTSTLSCDDGCHCGLGYHAGHHGHAFHCEPAVDGGVGGGAVSCGIGVCQRTGGGTCSDGWLDPTCTPGAPTGDDTDCDGLDDDCDGQVDEGFVGSSVSCGQGACVAQGTTSCSGGSVVNSCQPGTPSGDDTDCDAIDDDCDGTVDDGYVATTTSCGVGACAAQGTRSCVAGQETDSCVAAGSGGPDTDCDGEDDDCDGVADDGYVGTATSCGVGACAATGTTSCVSGAVRDSCEAAVSTGDDSDCDGLDDDCDGSVDEAYAPVATTCGVGVCAATGTTSCISGSVTDSCSAGSPTGNDSVCNGLDDDCDGSVDEAYASVATTCGVGVCAAAGSTSCVSGAVADSCAAAAPTGDDAVCNGLDDDCDGSVDEAYASVATSCGVGVCAATGTTSCVSGFVADSCTAGAPTGSDSICNGLDDDCDGSVDEAYASVATTCGVGTCAATGTTTCVSGAVADSCAASAPTGDDSICNGLDDDCDGSVDEAYASVATSCGVGVCAATGTTSCVSGSVADSCAAGSPSGNDSVCNGLDDDCDGSVDEAYDSVATSCGAGVCAATGTTSCVSGSVADSCSASAPTGDDSVCNGLDDDCDGSVDEAYASVATSCGVGVCAAAGSTSCVSGSVMDSCTVALPIGDDSVCNGLDDDCDGLVDEGFSSTSTGCGVGACARGGSLVCSAGSVVDTCVPGTAASGDATCDGVDDDCDGAIDENCCTPRSCVDVGAGCGLADDGCGGTIDCGGCRIGESCTTTAMLESVCAPTSLPPDPSEIAPNRDGVIDGAVGSAFGFLFGTVQLGVDAAAFEPNRAALVRGRVIGMDGSPIAGVRVSVRSDRRLGYTYTREDGRYDLLVEGGGRVVFDYERSLLLPVQRAHALGWTETREVDDVVMVRASPVSTEVAFGSTAPAQTFDSASVADADGARAVHGFVPAGTSAVAIVDGATVPFEGGALRVTEFTVGDRGPLAMPGDILDPVNYTFAAELGFDGLTADAEVHFDRPVVLYVDEFLGFPPGSVVPMAYYDRDEARWIPEEDGFVVELADIESNGLAVLRLSSTVGSVATSEQLTGFGITNAEREMLATRFEVGDRFWRIRRTHFSAIDANPSRGRKPMKPDPDDQPPAQPVEGQVACEQPGSIIQCDRRVLDEEIPVAGAPFALRYSSARVESSLRGTRVLRIPIHASDASVQEVQVRVDVLGRRIHEATVPTTTTEVVVEWDGRDAFGRRWNGPVDAIYDVRYVVEPEFALEVLDGRATFAGRMRFGSSECTAGDPCCPTSVGIPVYPVVQVAYRESTNWVPDTLWERRIVSLVAQHSAEALDLGGFTPSTMLRFDPMTETLAAANGAVRDLRDEGIQSPIVAGRESDGNVATHPNPDVRAVDADLNLPMHVDSMPDGSIVFIAGADGHNTPGRQIWKVTADGDLEPILLPGRTTRLIAAINTMFGVFPELALPLNRLSAGADGSLYVASDSSRLFRLIPDESAPDGYRPELLAGLGAAGGVYDYWADGQRLDRRRVTVVDVVVQGDGRVYALLWGMHSDGGPGWTDKHMVVEILPDHTGRIVRQFVSAIPSVMRRGPEGSLLLGGFHSMGLAPFVFRLDPDGTFRRLFGGDGPLPYTHILPFDVEMNADALNWEFAADLDLISDGSVLVTMHNLGIVRVYPNGRVRRIPLSVPNFEPKFRAPGRDPQLGLPRFTTVLPDGQVIVAEMAMHRILRIGSVERVGTAYRIDSEDGTTVHEFSASGRHLRDVDATTSHVIRSFAYDDEGRMTSTTDTDGRVTRFERPSADRIEIHAPVGPLAGGTESVTTLELDSDGYVREIQDPRAGQWSFDLDSEGLIEHLWNPRMNQAGVRLATPYTFTFDRATPELHSRPRLVSDTNPLGHAQTLTSTDNVTFVPTYGTWCDGTQYQRGWMQNAATSTVRLTSAVGTATTYASTRSAIGTVTRTVTEPSGASSSRSFRSSQSNEILASTDVTQNVHSAPDPWMDQGGRFVDAATTTVAAASGRPVRTQRLATARSAVSASNSSHPRALTSRTETTTLYAGTAANAPTRTATTQYVAATRTTTTTSGVGRSSAWIEDTRGRVAELRSPGQVPTQFSYDADGFLRSVVRTSGTQTRRVDYDYDARGYVSSVTTRASATTSLAVQLASNDAMGFPRTTTVSGVGTLSLRPGIDGLVEGLTPPDQPEHTFRYDVLGRETAYAPAGQTLPSAGCAPGVSCTTYDAGGRVTGQQHEDGTSTTVAYLPTRGLVDHVDVPSDGRYQFAYDGVGRPTTITAPDGGRVTYSWQASWPVREVYAGTHVVRDADTNAVVWTGALGGTIDRTYSEFLELETVSVTGGYAQRLTRDGDGLVTGLAPVTGTAVPPLTIARSALDGHATGTTVGVIGTSVSLDVDAGAPGFGDLRGLSATRTSDGSVLYDADYEVDEAGRIVRWTESVEGVTSDRRFDYDAASRLVGVRDAATNAALATYAYDGNGNRTRVLDVRAGAGAQDVQLGVNLGCDDPSTGAPLARAANAQDQLCRYGAFSYAYDGNGRLRSRTNTTTGQTLELRYDAAGRLHQARNEAEQTVHYVNDPLGRRIGRVVNGALERGWIYGSELAPIAEVNAAGQVTATYVYASRPNVPDLIVRTTGEVLRIVTDHLGSVRLVANVATGAVVHRMRFDEWGVLVEESGDSTVHPFGYAGGLYDRTTGLTRFGARDYDPVAGRWTAKDPIRFSGGDANLFEYATGRPVDRQDANGLRALPPIALDWLRGAGPWIFAFSRFPSREEHVTRNRRNHCMSLALEICDADYQRYYDPTPVLGGKYRFPDGSECRYDHFGEFVPTPEGGTFNFAPDPWTADHIVRDFVAHYYYGGSGAYESPDPTQIASTGEYD